MNFVEIQEEILSRTTRSVLSGKLNGSYTTRIQSLSKEFVKELVDYCRDTLELDVNKLVLYTGSQLIFDQYRLATYYPFKDHQEKKKYWSNNSEKFTKFVFTRDNEVRHLLTECIWHLKKRHCLSVFIGNDANGIDSYEDGLTLRLENWKIDDISFKEVNKIIKTNSLNDINDESLWEILFTKNIISSLEHDILPKLNNLTYRKHQYNIIELKRLFAHIIYNANFINKYVDYGQNIRNIFYLPDNRPGKTSGGAVIVFNIQDVKNAPTHEKILHLQEIITNFYLSNIHALESERLTYKFSPTEWTYEEHYYCNNLSTKKFIDEITKSCEKINLYRINGKKIVRILNQTFNTLTQTYNVPRGYDEISSIIFANVCKLWNILKLEKLPQLNEDDLIQIERNVTFFNKIPEQRKSPVLKLIYNALNYEDNLRLIPTYRDHFIHSFHVFCLGIWIIGRKIPSVNGKPFAFTDESLKQWFYASFLHDIGYSLEKIEEIADTFISSMFDSERIRPIIPMNPQWGHLSLVEEIRELFNEDPVKDIFFKSLKSFFSSNKSNVEPTEKNKEHYCGLTYERLSRYLFDNADHGIVSGILVYHCIKQKIKNFEVESKRYEWKKTLNKLMPSIIASIFHQSIKWKWKWPGHESEIMLSKDGFKVRLKDSSIAHLLIICDSIAQFGREFEDGNVYLLDRTIKLKDIITNESEIKVLFEYNNWDFNKYKYFTNDKIIEKFYDKEVRDFLEAQFKDATDNKISVECLFTNPPQEAKIGTVAYYR